ncbi:MAG: hypothetical protein MRY64_02885, partial [Hyphomonadaceae bacterium]|nr:hypothetical protein [Hyphomonadaceae bacterium]
ADPDYTVARADLVAALAAYFEQDNRGRAVAFVAQDGHARLLGDISALLADAGHEDAADRVVLNFAPTGLQAPNQPDLQSLVVLPLPAEMAGLHLSHLLFLPNWPQFHGHIPDMEAASEVLEGHVADALARAQADARKRVEPFGEMEDVDFIPVMRPNETGVPSAPAADAPPG